VDSGFLEELYRRYSRSVFRRACTLMGESEAGKDVAQEVFLRAFEAHAEFTAAASPLSWLYRITTNICLNRLRDARRRREILARNFLGEDSAVRPTTDAALTVRALLGAVPEPMQEIAVYYYVDQMTQDEIASLLAVPRRTVGYRLEQFLTIVRAQARELAS
jgi:RNA polymerase sigma-70 factor (ECF subfamily)